MSTWVASLMVVFAFIIGIMAGRATAPASIALSAAGEVSAAVGKRVDSDKFQKSLDEACEENPKLKRCLLRR
jgi:hypothetical protein